MKKIIVYLLFCIFVSSCNLIKNDVIENNSIISNKGVFEGVVADWDINLDEIYGFIEFTLDEETALEIADVVLKKIFGDEVINKTSFIVVEAKGKDYYIICRLPDSNVPGEDYNVAINKTDGKILKVWMGE